MANPALEEQITQTKHDLDAARRTGDELKIALAESVLNELLSQLSQLSHPKED